VKAIHSRLSLIMNFEIDEAETFAPTFVIQLYDSRSNCAVSLERLDKLVLGHVRVDIFDIQVRELGTNFLELRLTFLARDMMPNIDFLVVKKHPIDGFDSGIGGLSGLIVDIAITTRAALLIGGYLAR
jgi:hypothetical protein